MCIKFKRSKLVYRIALSAVFVTPSISHACSGCQQTRIFGQEEAAEVQSSTQAIGNLASQVAQGFTSIVSSVVLGTEMLANTVQASSATISQEVKRSTEANSRLMEAMDASENARMQAAFVQEHKQKADRTYGAENMPAEACEAFAHSDELIEALNQIKPLKQLIQENREAKRVLFDAAREGHTSVLREKYLVTRLQEVSAESDLSKLSLTTEETQKAIEWASLVTEPEPPVSIRDENGDLKVLSGVATPQQVRTTTEVLLYEEHMKPVNEAFDNSIALKAPAISTPDGEYSVLSFMAGSAADAFDKERLEELAASSPAATLRSLVRGQQMENWTKFESLKVKLNSAMLLALPMIQHQAAFVRNQGFEG
ncbi:hypothetical protein [Marinobacterium jannaschii]|uniref:hypothetical protein n=1 Tax=Marinobacterium jannaschii TaxID=64970 RepID=UPI0004815DE9|nr:hypothetical protein [Marinobacterium jannaschii]